jgi:hypothetical protein
MKKIKFFILLGILLLVVSGCGKKDVMTELESGKIDLRLKFTEGESTAYDLIQTLEVETGILGMSFSIPVEQKVGVVNKTRSVDDDGTAYILQKIDYFEQDSDISQFQAQTLIQELVGAEFAISLSPKGEFELIESDFDFNRLGDTNFNMESMVNQSYSFLPDDPVGLGDEWMNESTSIIPGKHAGNLKTIQEVNYTLVDVQEKDGYQCVKIHVDGKIYLDMSKMESFGAADLEANGVVDGEIYFSPGEGKVIYSESDTELTVTSVVEEDNEADDLGLNSGSAEIKLKNHLTMNLRESD